MSGSARKEATEDAVKIVIRSQFDRKAAKDLVDTAQDGYSVSITPPVASDELTARLHCAIRCISRQVRWAGEKLSEEDWKRLLVGSLYGQRILPAVSGSGFVVLDRRTSRMASMTKHELLEFIYSFGAERNVEFED